MKEILWWQSLSKELKDKLLQEYVSTLNSLGYNTQIKEVKHHHILAIYHNQKSE